MSSKKQRVVASTSAVALCASPKGLLAYEAKSIHSILDKSSGLGRIRK